MPGCFRTSPKVNRCLTEGRRALAQRLAKIDAGIEWAKPAPLLGALVDGDASAEQRGVCARIAAAGDVPARSQRPQVHECASTSRCWTWADSPPECSSACSAAPLRRRSALGRDGGFRTEPGLGRKRSRHGPAGRALRTLKSPANAEPFLRAAEGIRTLDLLHGKQSAGLGAARNIAANRPLLPRERVPPMPGIYREITGVSGLKPDWR
jgi:hypothetical protein